MKSTNATQINIRLLPLLKLTTAIGISTGWILGVLSLIVSLFGGTPIANVFGFQFSGVAAGMVNMIWVPVILSVFLGILAAASYWPCVWVLRAIGGVQLDLENVEPNSQRRASEPRREELISR